MNKTLDDEILVLLSTADRPLTITQIATSLKRARHTVARHLDTFLLTGMVMMRQHGNKKSSMSEKISPLPQCLLFYHTSRYS